MSTKKKDEQVSRPASTPEAREQQLINLAVNLAERQLRDGTASPSVITHFLKFASAREKLEREILEKNSRLIDAKAKNIDKERESEETAKAAIEAMRKYSPGQ
jgi:EAL domain-containing protein (putative c-di-GMP-specific phosphodiesterase class I)